MTEPGNDDEQRQVSEMSDMDEAQGGGADATDKSTGTAPRQAEQDEGADAPEGKE